MSGRGKHPPRKPQERKFPELPPKYSASRELRNKAEKLRRNRLNGYLAEIKHLVPVIKDKTKKTETTRTNILRVSANYIRLKKLFPHGTNETDVVGGPVSQSNNHAKVLNGVLFLLSETGKIVFIADSIEQHIGYTQLDLLGMSLLEFVHPGDRQKLLRNLARPGSASSPSIASNSPSSTATSSSPSPSASTHPVTTVVPSMSTSSSNKQETGVRKSFYIRLREKTNNRTDRPKYEHMHLIGHFRETAEGERRASKDLEFVFVGLMKPVEDRSITALSLMESVADQYLTRHLPDGRIISTDHRISTIAGYLPSDVQGKSAFNFMLGEDLPWTTLALRTMFASSKGEGICTYRLRTRFGSTIFLQSRGFLEFSKESQNIEYFTCINTVLSEKDAKKYMEEQQERFTPYIAELKYSNSLPILPDLPTYTNIPGIDLKRKFSVEPNIPNFVPKVLKLEPKESPKREQPSPPFLMYNNSLFVDPFSSSKTNSVDQIHSQSRLNTSLKDLSSPLFTSQSPPQDHQFNPPVYPNQIKSSSRLPNQNQSSSRIQNQTQPCSFTSNHGKHIHPPTPTNPNLPQFTIQQSSFTTLAGPKTEADGTEPRGILKRKVDWDSDDVVSKLTGKEYSLMKQMMDYEKTKPAESLPQLGHVQQGRLPQLEDVQQGRLPQLEDVQQGRLPQLEDVHQGRLPQLENVHQGTLTKLTDVQPVRRLSRLPELGDLLQGGFPDFGEGGLPVLGNVVEEETFGRLSNVGEEQTMLVSTASSLSASTNVLNPNFNANVRFCGSQKSVSNQSSNTMFQESSDEVGTGGPAPDLDYIAANGFNLDLFEEDNLPIYK